MTGIEIAAAVMTYLGFCVMVGKALEYGVSPR